MKIKVLSAFFVLLLFIVSGARAQEGYTVKKDSLQSGILKQLRKINIFLPEGYEKETAKYPVIYVLDADGRDQHIVPTARFLFVNGKMPKVIIVGVFNIDRNHDFLPDSMRSAATGGGADNFAAFFRKELKPYVEKNFRTENYSVLVGHSFGGVFAINTLISDPSLFDAYIAIDPSVWYKNRMLIGRTHESFVKSGTLKNVLFVTGRMGNGMRDMGVDALDSLLKKSAPEGLAWKVVPYADEDHGSVTFKSAYDGLRFIFDSGGSADIFPYAAILPKGESTVALVMNNHKQLHFTTDGSEPTAESPVCTDTIRITGPCTLKVKSTRGNYSKSPVITRVFAEGAYWTGTKSIKNLKPGLKYSLYEGVWDSLPDFSALKPVKKGITPAVDLAFLTKKDSVAVKFEGYLQIRKQGLYLLWITSDDGARLYLDSKLVLNNNGLHDASKPMTKLLPLMPGFYQLTIEYFEKTGDESVTIGRVDAKYQPLPFNAADFFHKE
jgi:predicted alpha/beta superfamily hydrolase